MALQGLAELLPDPGHGQEHRWAARREVFGDGGKVAGEPGLAGHGYGQEVAHHPFGYVAEGQERQEALALADVVDGRDVAQRPHDVRVTEHGSLGRATGSARVHNRREILGPDLTTPLVDSVGIAPQPVGASAPERVKADDE